MESIYIDEGFLKDALYFLHVLIFVIYLYPCRINMVTAFPNPKYGSLAGKE